MPATTRVFEASVGVAGTQKLFIHACLRLALWPWKRGGGAGRAGEANTGRGREAFTSGGCTRADRPRVTTLPFTREDFPCAVAGSLPHPTPPPPPVVCLLVLFSPCPPSPSPSFGNLHSTGVQGHARAPLAARLRPASRTPFLHVSFDCFHPFKKTYYALKKKNILACFLLR